MDFLERIQSKPSNVKTRYAFFGAGFVTIAIALVWMSTIPARFAEVSLNTDKKEDTKEAPSLGELVNDTKNQLGNVIESIEDVQEVKTPTSMDALAMPDAETPEATPTEPAPSNEAITPPVATTAPNLPPLPVLTEGGETHQVLETPKKEGKMILIGTTTSTQ